MALFKPIKMPLSELNGIEKREGQFLVATDTGEAFVDVGNNSRVQLSFSNIFTIFFMNFADGKVTRYISVLCYAKNW